MREFNYMVVGFQIGLALTNILLGNVVGVIVCTAFAVSTFYIARIDD